MGGCMSRRQLRGQIRIEQLRRELLVQQAGVEQAKLLALKICLQEAALKEQLTAHEANIITEEVRKIKVERILRQLEEMGTPPVYESEKL